LQEFKNSYRILSGFALWLLVLRMESLAMFNLKRVPEIPYIAHLRHYVLAAVWHILIAMMKISHANTS
jgi:hypothetical protein